MTSADLDFKPFLFLNGYQDNLGVGTGWYPLIYDLCTKLLEYLCNYRAGDKAFLTNFRVILIKEKFGGLWFHTEGGDSCTNNLISYYENKSYTVCELCGKDGQPRPLSWIKTLCKKCYWDALISWEFKYCLVSVWRRIWLFFDWLFSK